MTTTNEAITTMRMSDEVDKLFAALVKARSGIGAIPKSGHNKFDDYDYSTLDDYMKAIQEPLQSNGLHVLWSLEQSESLGERPTAKGKTEYASRVHIVGRLIHSTGQWCEVRVSGDGQDRSDKALYKGYTGARKYGLAMLLNLATEDDPEKSKRDAGGNGKGRQTFDGKSANGGDPLAQQGRREASGGGGQGSQQQSGHYNGVITAVEKQAKQNDKGEYTLYKVSTEANGRTGQLSTFDDDLGQHADRLAGTGAEVGIGWKRNGQYLNLVGIDEGEAQREPGEDDVEQQAEVAF